jgi:hypothetical protein
MAQQAKKSPPQGWAKKQVGNPLWDSFDFMNILLFGNNIFVIFYYFLLAKLMLWCAIAVTKRSRES